MQLLPQVQDALPKPDVEVPGSPCKSLEVPGSPWKSLEVPGSPWKSLGPPSNRKKHGDPHLLDLWQFGNGTPSHLTITELQNTIFSTWKMEVAIGHLTYYLLHHHAIVGMNINPFTGIMRMQRRNTSGISPTGHGRLLNQKDRKNGVMYYMSTWIYKPTR